MSWSSGKALFTICSVNTGVVGNFVLFDSGSLKPSLPAVCP